jgi:acetoin utilization protein AcuB
MTRQVVSVSPDMGIREAFFLMKENSIRHLPIIDESKKLIGIISDRELRRPNWVDEAHDISHVYYLDNSMHVRDVMIKNVHVLHTYDTLAKAVTLLLDHGIGAAPVLDKTQSLVGMLSAIDLLRALADMINEEKAGRKKKG